VHGARQQLQAAGAVLCAGDAEPIELEGTYPLPEAQLDRFLFNTVLDYLTADEELQVVDLTTVTTIAHADPVTNPEEILDFQQLVRMVRSARAWRAMPWTWCAYRVPAMSRRPTS